MNKVFTYRAMDGKVRTVGWDVLAYEDIPGNILIRHLEVYPTHHDHIVEYKLMYYGKTDLYWSESDRYSHMDITPEAAVYYLVPWHMLESDWADFMDVQVLDADLWAKLVTLRAAEKAEIARHKAEREKIEAERRAKERQENAAYYAKLEAGDAFTKRKAGTFQRRMQTKPGGEWVDTEGYLVVNRETETPLPFGIHGGSGYWTVTHIPTGYVIVGAHSQTLKAACAVAGALYTMHEHLWHQHNPNDEMTETEEKEIEEFLRKYRIKAWN